MTRLVVPAAALAAGLVFLPAAAQPPLPPDSPLRYVPADAAVFVHADAAALWAGPVGEAVRKAAPKEADAVVAQARQVFGAAPEQLKTVTIFWPKAAGPADVFQAGVVLRFKTPYDKAALKAGVEKNLPSEAPIAFVAKDATTAVLLIGGLNGSYATPRPATEAGPLSAYLREAAAGAHVVSAGTTMKNLPPEIRGANLPPDVEAFRPLFQADAAALFLDIGKELALDVRVTAATAAKAGDAEKALGVLVNLAREGLNQIPARELADPAMKSTAAVLAAVKGGLAGAKFSTTGTETRARLVVAGEQPWAGAMAEAAVKVRGAAARSVSFNNLKQIGLAMHIYHDATGTFPPAAVVDKAGRPLLSWRVLLLPYLEQEQLYRQFKLDEPWDGPTNKKLLARMPKLYALPEQLPSKAKADETHYQVFVGKGAAFDLPRGARINDFTDGTSNTLLVATAAVPVPWTKPDDVAFDPAADMTAKLAFLPDVAHAALCDGSVRALRKTIDRKSLAGLITRGGGEVLGPNDF